MQSISVVLALTCLAALSLARPGDEPTLSSELHDGVVVLLPAQISFTIPDSWLKWHKSSKNNLHFSRKELDKVRVGEGEWDSEFSRVVNAILPFDKCAFHGGEEGWGREAAAYGDLQMRAYVGDWDLPRLREFVKSAGLKEAKSIDSKTDFIEAKEGKWQVDSLIYYLRFGDYGGTAHIDLYSRNEEGVTAVLVFMYNSYPATQQEEIKEVIDSFVFAKKDSKNQKGQQSAGGERQCPPPQP